MSIITVWTEDTTEEVKTHQLSDDPDDGTPAEQIAYLATLSVFQNYTCVSEDYQGTYPDTDPSLWRWDGSAIISV